MLFNSINFLIFFPAVVVLYYVIPDRTKRYMLLFASYYFYMCWNAKYIALIVFSTAITYFCGIALENTSRRNEDKRIAVRRRKAIIALSLFANVSLLFFFKYYDFFWSTISDAADIIGIYVRFPDFDVMLPVGISFYTFQSLGYIIDVYRGDVSAEHDFVNYALFVSFFPQLVAGPIERTGSLLPQLKVSHRFDIYRFREGFLYMLWGYFLKLVIADRIAIVVDTVYSNVSEYPGLYQVMAAGLFAFQIYGDFAGYSMIAMGSSKILGVDIMYNFDSPYISSTVTEFWRRWHISLTSWFKDYLYIPLGGNRKGRLRKAINKMIVFSISGLWHGAEWSFVIWGALNGLYLVAAEFFMPMRIRFRRMLHINTSCIVYRVIAIIITFIMVDIAWIFFRAETISEALTVVKLMFSVYNPEIIFSGKIYGLGVEADSFRMMVFCIIFVIVVDILRYKEVNIVKWIIERNTVIRASIIIFSTLFILVFGAWGPSFDVANFIYFQF